MTRNWRTSGISKILCSVVVLPSLFTFGCGSDTGGLDPSRKNPLGAGPAAVTVDTSDPAFFGAYAILAKSGVSDAGGSSVKGNVGVSPAAATYITGFSLVADSSNEFSTSSSVDGKVFAANYAVPTPANLTSAVSSMEAAYTDLAGRTIPDFVELAGGDIGGRTLTPGLYKWSTNVTIPSDATINGGKDDVWIFQISGDLILADSTEIHLAGGGMTKNIFWQVAGQVIMGTSSHFEGNIFSQTAITLNTSASMNGRALAQSAVSLDDSSVTRP